MPTVAAARPRLTTLAHVIGAVELLLVALLSLVAWQFIVSIGLFIIGAAGTGWVLASRVPRNPLGWMLQFSAGCFLLAFVGYWVGDLTVGLSPVLTAWLGWLAGTDDWGWLWLPSIGLLFTQLLLRFPDGGLPSRRWRWFSRFTIVALTAGTLAVALSPATLRHGANNPVQLQWVEAHGTLVTVVVSLSLLVSFVGSVASLFVRYRGADDVGRHQLRWVVWAAALVVLCYVASFVSPWSFTNLLVQGAYALIPVAMAVAVLRYHLFDIDRILSRTVSYALVTGVLLATYAVVVTAVGRVAPDSSTLAVSAATLAAAAMLRPVLGVIRRWVDRRFNRQRYDAEHTVERFGAALRDQVDVESVVGGLVDTVGTTMQPRSITVWRPTSR
jgi:hypothetical protein